MTQWIRWSLPLLLIACAGQSGSSATPEANAADGAPAASSGGIPDVVATVDGQSLTRDDLMEFAGAEIIQAEVQAAQARADAVDALITNTLLEAEAKARGTDVDSLMRTEVEAKASPPTDEEIAQFYAENQARINGTLEQAKPQLAQYLSRQKAQEAMQAFLSSLESGKSIERNLEPYRVALDDGANAPRWGSATAPIQIIEYSDFQCPYCGIGAETIEKVKDKYGDKVSVVYRHFPLPMHAEAPRAAEASACADEQGKFWEFHDALFADRKAWTDDDFLAMAKDVGLKKKPFKECLESGKHAATVEADMEAGRRVGMSGTPGFYINGIVLSGAQPIEKFSAVIDRELARK